MFIGQYLLLHSSGPKKSYSTKAACTEFYVTIYFGYSSLTGTIFISRASVCDVNSTSCVQIYHLVQWHLHVENALHGLSTRAQLHNQLRFIRPRGNGMDASERTVRASNILDITSGRAGHSNSGKSLRRGDIQLLRHDQDAVGERLRNFDGRSRHDQHNLLHLPLHRLLLPMGAVNGRRGREEYRHRVRYTVLHSRSADRIDESRQGEASRTIVP